EKELLKLKPGIWPRQAIKDASWRAEALGVIAWALNLLDSIPPYDQQHAEASLVRAAEEREPTAEFVSSARVRPAAEIRAAREIAENWHWRARTTQNQTDPAKYPPPAGWTYQKIIRMAAEHWEKQGLFKAIQDDYPAHGKAYCELTV